MLVKRLMTLLLFIGTSYFFNAKAQVNTNNSWALRVSGNVTDHETGLPLPGVNVLVKGTNIGGTTDEKGNYSISAPSGNATLVFSFIGHNTKEKPINNKTTLNLLVAMFYQ